MANILLRINEFQKRKDDTFTIYLTTRFEGKRTRINTEVFTTMKEWDNEKMRIRGKSKSAQDRNLILQKQMSIANEILVRYRLQQKNITTDQFIKEFKNPALFSDFYTYAHDQVQRRWNTGEISDNTNRNYRSLLSIMRSYKDQMSISELDRDFIVKFQAWLVRSGRKVNTVNKLMVNLKSIVTTTFNEEVITHNPFSNVKIVSEAKPDRISLSIEELSEMKRYYVENILSSHLHRTLRNFLFMCTTGIRISDHNRMKFANLDDHILRFIPHKTRTKKQIHVNIPLTNFAIQLIDDENSSTEFLFDTISEQKRNKQIQEVAEIIGIKKHITNHVARHTFATLFLEKTNDVATLQKLLGHSKITETMTYVHISQRKIEEQMKVFGEVF